MIAPDACLMRDDARGALVEQGVSPRIFAESLQNFAAFAPARCPRDAQGASVYTYRTAGRGVLVTGGPQDRLAIEVAASPNGEVGGIVMTIRNPIEWSLDQFRLAAVAMGAAGDALHAGEGEGRAAPLPVNRVGLADLEESLKRGVDDFMAYRTDVVFLCAIFPLMGLVIVRLASGYDMVPLLFPLASGFALIGPFAAVGLYEMSRRREQGAEISWPDAFGALRARSIGAILALGFVLTAIFLLWIIAAWQIYAFTLGPQSPDSISRFASDVLTTGAGWAMIAAGVGVGFLFACLAFALSVVSFPLMLDRDATLGAAIGTSFRAIAANPGPMALWGLVVAGGLVLGSIPVLLGLIVVLPVFGHATWHLYRRLVP